MADECKVFEMRTPRTGAVPIRPVPFLARQDLSSTEASAAFSAATTMITVVSTLAGGLTFGLAPDGTGIRFPILADTPYDFDVTPGHKVRFD